VVALPHNRYESRRYETVGRRRAALGTHGGRVSRHSRSGVTAPMRTRSPRKYQKTPVRVEKTLDEQAQARIRQYRLQELAGDILPNERGLNACMRCRVSVADHVELVWAEDGSANYTHLQTCGSIWLCAPCAAREAEWRRKILERLDKKFVDGDDGGSIWMTGYTVSHHDYDDLGELVTNFLAARKKMREGRQGMALRHDFDIVGTISVLEITWSEENGGHPHVHELVYCRHKHFDADRYEELARSAWKRAAAAFGMTMNRHGFDLRRTYGEVQDYVTKFGHAPASDRCWGTESEMVKGHLKKARAGLSPMGMLSRVIDIQDAMRDIRQELLEVSEEMRRAELLAELRELGRQQVMLRGKFREYARAFKGRKQLNPSKGVQPLWKAAEAEIEAEEQKEKEGEGKERKALIEFYDDQWGEVVRHRLRGELREEGRTGRPGWVLEYLASACGVEVFPEQYTRFEGWRVYTREGPGRILSIRYVEEWGRWWCSVELEEPGLNGQRWYYDDFVEITLGKWVDQAQRC
jgi:hypothetical protein